MQRSTVLRCLYGVRSKAGGRPPSRPRRFQVAAWSAGPGRLLMGPDDRGVDRDDPLQVALSIGLSEQGGEDLLPRPVDRPHPQPVVGALPRPKALRQIHPRHAGAVLEHDCIDHLPVIPPPPTPPRRPVRQQRLDPRPLRISQRHINQRSDDPKETT